MQSEKPGQNLSEESCEEEFDEESFEEIEGTDTQSEAKGNIDELEFEEITDEKAKKHKISESKQKRLIDWIKVTKYGSIIEGTNILPMKTPMSRKKWTDHTEKQDQFDLVNFIKELKEQGKNVAAVVDLNCSDGGYYDWYWLEKKNKDLLKNIDYKKIKILSKEMPTKATLNKVYDVLNKNAFKKDSVVLVHCTKGVNRTGHAICYFLCKRFELKADVAMKRFEAARGYPINKKEVIDDLEDRFA